MSIAVIYDIHGNLPALEAVLADVKHEEVEGIVVGGDVIAGPLPGQTLSLLQNLNIPTHFISGNAESELLRRLAGKEIEALSERAVQETYWGAETLSEKQKQFISEWPATIELEFKELGTVLFCHATPNSDIRVFTVRTPEEELLEIFDNLGAPIVICGHTHMPFDRDVGNIRVVNAGSVGMPFGNTGADWLILDTEIVFKHTSYDLKQAAKRIRDSDYPYAEDFISKNIMQTPSKKEALDMLSQIEDSQKSRN